MYDARTKLAEQVERAGSLPLRHQGVSNGDPADGADLGGAVVRSAGDGLRLDITRCPGVSRAGEGGESWRDPEGWVEGWRVDPDRLRGRPDGEASRISRSRRSARTHSSRASTSTRRRSPRLAESIREVGVLQPVLVREADEGYELIAVNADGARPAGRVADAARDRAGRRRRAMLQQAIIENVQREQLNRSRKPPRPAADRGLRLTHDEVATRVGKSRATITNTLRLLQLPDDPAPPEGRNAPDGPRPGAARPTPTARSKSSLPGAVAEDLSVREVEEAVRRREESQADRARRRWHPEADCGRRDCSNSRSSSATFSRRESVSRWGLVTVECRSTSRTSRTSNGSTGR
jgi:ParB/RepB/Spo0J family partition protein